MPAVTIQRGPTGTFVYVVGSDNVAEMRLVDLLFLQGDAAIIAPVDPSAVPGAGGLKKGLNPGEIVVTDGQSQLKPGSKVAARGAESKGSPGASSSASSGNPRGERPAAGADPGAAGSSRAP